MTLCVFLGNKLISTDTITPVLMAIKERNPRKSIHAYILDGATMSHIQKNGFLFEALTRVAHVHFKGSPPGRPGLFHRAVAMTWFASFLLWVLLKRPDIIHFGRLNKGPYRWISKVARSRVFLFSSSCWLIHSNEIIAANHGRFRQTGLDASRSVGEFRVGFTEDWSGFVGDRRRDFLMPPSRSMRIWLDYVRSRADETLQREFQQLGYAEAPQRLIFVPLGYFGMIEMLPDDQAVRRAFREMLRVLAETAQDVPIILKPHAITAIDIVKQEIGELDASNIHISYLHPAVILTRAVLCISNYYSTVQADAKMFGVKTIEYTEYSNEFLEVADKQSLNPAYIDVFIQRDTAALRAHVQDTLNASECRPMAVGNEDTSGVVARLAGAVSEPLPCQNAA